MLAMNDQNSGKPNSGNFLLRVNRRTQALADAWVAGAAPDFHDQQVGALA